MRFKVAVVAAGDVLALVRSAAPDVLATDVVEADTDLIIAAGAKAAPHVARHARQVVLTDDDATDGGPWRITRAAFVAAPACWLSTWRELVESDQRASNAAKELENARHIESLFVDSDIDSVFQRVTRAVIAEADTPAVTLLLHDPVVERFVAVFGTDPDYRDTGAFLPSVAPELLQSALSSTEGFAISHSEAKGASAVMPILAGDDLAGVFKLTKKGEAFDDERIRATAHYVRSVTPVLLKLHQLSKSKDLALRDDLTKAFNRRYFEAHLDEEIERAKRYNSVVSIIFLDLDDLKLVNNRYGHLAGSRMLQEVARRILGAVRGIDKVVRFGGDEFCVILPQTDPEQAYNVASRIRSAMAQRPFTLEAGIDLPMSASFGISTYPVHAGSKEDLIHKADAAMYSVKSSTKNAISVASSDAPIRATNFRFSP